MTDRGRTSRSGRLGRALAVTVAILGLIAACSPDAGVTDPDNEARPTAVPPEVALPSPASDVAAGPAVASPDGDASGGGHVTQVVVIPAASPAIAPTTVPAELPSDGASPTAAARLGPYVPEESVDRVDKRLNVTIGGETVYIRNGGRVELGDDLAVEIYLDPYPPTSLHSVIDLYVTDGEEPISDASIDVEFDMLSMAHGPFVATAREIGGGHHLATLDYIMFGAWDQFVTIRRGLDRIRFPVVIVAYP